MSMREFIKNYCNECAICRRSKVSRHTSYEMLSSLSISKFKCFNIIMIFVINLSSSIDWTRTNYDSILIIVDKFTKMTHYIFVTKKVTTKQLIDIFIKKLIRHHDVLKFIVTNREFLFNVDFHFSLCYVLKIKRKLFTIFYSQTNDQTKRQFSCSKWFRVCSFKTCLKL